MICYNLKKIRLVKKANPKQMTFFFGFGLPYFKENLLWTKEMPKLPKWNEPTLFFPLLSIKQSFQVTCGKRRDGFLRV